MPARTPEEQQAHYLRQAATSASAALDYLAVIKLRGCDERSRDEIRAARELAKLLKRRVGEAAKALTS